MLIVYVLKPGCAIDCSMTDADIHVLPIKTSATVSNVGVQIRNVRVQTLYVRSQTREYHRKKKNWLNIVSMVFFLNWHSYFVIRK